MHGRHADTSTTETAKNAERKKRKSEKKEERSRRTRHQMVARKARMWLMPVDMTTSLNCRRSTAHSRHAASNASK
eukprot:524531-Rhodomonas_salina.1